MMERRQLGRSGIELSVVGLGTWVFGGRWGGADDADSKAAVHAALDAGVNWIDTADIYGQGRAERIVGEVVRERGDEVLVATKGGVAWEVGPDGLRIWRDARGEYLRMACERSLTALGLDHIDLYQVHWPVAGVPAQETMEAMLDLQRRGLVRAIGVSNYTRADLEAAAAAARFDSYQPGYHMMRRQVELAELPWCAENEVGVIAYGPLAHGLFTGRMDAATTFPENDWRASSEFFTDEVYPERVAAVRELAAVAEQGGRPGGIAELAVAWVLRRPEVTSAIIGGRNAEQARANAALAGRPLSADEEAAVDAILAAHPGVDRPYGHGEPAQPDSTED
ncbi:MAG: aldo/keto reductase [Thermoleophilia bacterium]|jgi:aryl-alcohol dehydrogenase-like predicted oxidoreductase